MIEWFILDDSAMLIVVFFVINELQIYKLKFSALFNIFKKAIYKLRF
jgi:hypothetical protein